MKKILLFLCFAFICVLVNGCGVFTQSGEIPLDSCKEYLEFIKSDKRSYKAHIELADEENTMLVDIYVEGKKMKIELDNGGERVTNYLSYDDTTMTIYGKSETGWYSESFDIFTSSENCSMLIILSSIASIELIDLNEEDFTVDTTTHIFTANSDKFSKWNITNLEFFLVQPENYTAEFHFNIFEYDCFMVTDEANNVKVELPN